AAQIDSLVRSLPGQYGTLVGERGVRLSGGERQRIAIARAILKNPPILVLDEATAALDTRSERAIQNELDRLAHDRTTLLIAHRLSTVVDADEILVMEHGRVVERGTHGELLAKAGVYSQMWDLQQQQRDLELAAQRLALQPLNLGAMVVDVIDGLRGAFEDRGIKLYVSIVPEPIRVTADLAGLHEAIWNAAAHMIELIGPSGSLELRLERRGSDAWLGMRGAVAPNWTEATTDRDAGKPALDLAATEALLARSGGRFQWTQDDTRVRVSFEMPLRAPGTAPAGMPIPAKLPPLDGIAVACVDRDDRARELLREVLAARGVDVRTFASGNDALAWFAATPFEQWPQVILC